MGKRDVKGKYGKMREGKEGRKEERGTRTKLDSKRSIIKNVNQKRNWKTT